MKGAVSGRRPTVYRQHVPGSLSVVLPGGLAALTLAAICLTAAASHDQKARLWVMAGTGLIAWPLVEYGLHRFILHGLKPFSTWHAAHHEGAPAARPGLKTLLGALLIFIAAFTPAAMMGQTWPGMGLSLGLLAGYGTYVAIHDAIHHRHCGHRWLMRRKFHHALHHDAHRPPGYYGVTSAFWDDILGTHHAHEF